MTSRWDILQQGLSKEPRENVWIVAKFAISEAARQMGKGPLTTADVILLEVIMKHLQVIVARGKAEHG